MAYVGGELLVEMDANVLIGKELAILEMEFVMITEATAMRRNVNNDALSSVER